MKILKKYKNIKFVTHDTHNHIINSFCYIIHHMAYEPPITLTGIPHFLIPPDTPDFLTDYSWNTILTGLRQAETLMSIVTERLARPDEYGRILDWIHRDVERETAYYKAREVGMDKLVDEMIDIADAVDSVEDVARSQLRITTRKWVASSFNRKRYGDVKQVDTTVTLDISKAMEEAQIRVIEHNTPRLIIDAEVDG